MPTPTLTPARPSGFTLIELLVAVVVVGLMLGLLLPSLGAARGVERIGGAVDERTVDFHALDAAQAPPEAASPSAARDDAAPPKDSTGATDEQAGE